jgi:hypothetical protein
MEVTMSNAATIAAVVVFVLYACAMAIALLTLPRWLGRTFGRDRIWRLRDEFVREVLVDEALPNDHPAVRQLLAEMDWVLRDGKHVALLHLRIVERALRGLDELKRQQLARRLSPKPLGDLHTEQCDRMAYYRHRFEVLVTGAMLLGSWLGLVQVARMFPVALAQASQVEAQSSIRRVDQIRHAPREATDRAATETPRGKKITRLFRDMKDSWFAPRWQEHELGYQQAHIA